VRLVETVFPMRQSIDVRNASVPEPNPGLYLQYGCGLTAPHEWLNFDASPRLRLEKLWGVRWILAATVGLHFPPGARPGNVVDGLPIRHGSVSAVYCSHVLEHLPRDDVARALRNTFDMLIPGGVFRLVVPDLNWRIREYLFSSEAGSASAADRFIAGCIFGRRSKLSVAAVLKDYFGNSAHLWMYDYAALKDLLERAGFVQVRRCEFGDGDRMFRLVERRERFFEGDQRELAIQALKPSDRSRA
jgi:SAM-dependent methyltransferase